MHRREYLTAIGATSVAALAGCFGGDGGNQSQSLDSLPSKSNFEEYKPAWLELARQKAQEEGGEFTTFGFSQATWRKNIDDFFSDAPKTYDVLTPTVPLANNDQQLQKYAQSAQAQQPVVDVMMLGNLNTLRTSQQIPMGQMDDIPAYIEVAENLKVNGDDLGDVAAQTIIDRGINYNTDMVSKSTVQEQLNSWPDLLKDEFTGTSAVLDFTFNPAVADAWLTKDWTAPDGSSISARNLANGIKENLDFQFVASATEGAAMIARGDAAMQLMGAANFILTHRNDDLPVDHVRANDTLFPYADPIAVSAYPHNEWTAKLAAQAFMTQKPLVVNGFGTMAPNRSVGGTHSQLGSTVKMFEGDNIYAPFQIDNSSKRLTKFQEVWGAPA